MPMGYDFVSPWAMAQQALVNYFDKQDALKRQAEIDQLNRSSIESQIEDRKTNRRIQEENAESLAELRRQSAAKFDIDAQKAETADLLAQSEQVPIGTDITGSQFGKRASKIPGMVASKPIAEPIPQREGIASLEKPEEGARALPGVVMPSKQTFAGTRQQRGEAAVAKAMAENPALDEVGIRRAALEGGMAPKDIENIVEKAKKSKPETKPVYRQSRSGALSKVQDVEANAVITHEPAPQLAGVNLTNNPNATEMLARNFLATGGKLPNLGRNAGAAIQQIINQAALISAAESGGDLATNKALYDATSKALSDRTKSTAAMDQFANAAIKNLDLALQASPQVTRTDSASINRIANAFVRNAMPAEKLTDFEVKIYTAAREYAKVAMGASASAAGLTDSAAAEAEKLLNAAQSPAAFKAAVAAMKQDMGSVQEAAHDELDVLTRTLKGGAGRKPTAGRDLGKDW